MGVAAALLAARDSRAAFGGQAVEDVRRRQHSDSQQTGSCVTASTPREKSKPRVGQFILMGGAALVLTLLLGRLAWFRYLSETSRQITIGRETTYLDGPPSANGYVNYVAALNQRQSA